MMKRGKIIRRLEALVNRAKGNPKVLLSHEFEFTYVKYCERLRSRGLMNEYRHYVDFYSRESIKLGDGTTQPINDVEK